ncbi:MAG TPA: PQQ-dependent sugar dehydrogenase [Candidatus Methylacidiphilales bacterium]|nr:PQQ-dependent sugar dehydrogenase [Candidatus Methylacidiphilales bacterium]
MAKAGLPTPDPDDDGLKLPPGFHAMVVADNLGMLRFLAVADNGDLYARHNNILALRDTKGDGHFDVIQTFGVNGGKGQSGTGLTLWHGYLYYSNQNSVYRYKMVPGQLVPTGQPETIVKDLPFSDGHEAKSITFDEAGNMYIDVGSYMNVYSTGDRGFGAKGMDATEFLKTHGGIWRFKSDAQNQTQADGYHFSTGERHCIAIAMSPVSKLLFAVQMGRDNLNDVDPTDYTAEDNADGPAEEMHLLKDGVNFGWPYTYWDPRKNAHMIAPEFGGDNKKQAPPGKYDDPVIAFPGHWAPLQMMFYTGTQFPEKYRNGAFIAFHGSWDRTPLPQGGYNIVFVPFDSKGMPVGTYEVFADNFAGVPVIKTPHQAKYRPAGVAQGPDGSLYVSDTVKGRIWRIFYTGK